MTKDLTPRQSAHLDIARGLAAIAVLVSHARGLFFVDYSNVAQKTMLLGFWYAATGLGHQAVMIFFVLSGFFIGGGVVSTLHRWNWRTYMTNRCARLYLVLLPALLVTAVLDSLAYRAPAGHVYFDYPIRNFNATPLTGHDTFITFLGNAVFLQTIKVPVFGSNSPLWSLANEFWYYLLFPAFVVAAFGKRSAGNRLCSILVGLALVVWLPGGMIMGFVTWLLGVAVYQLPKVKLSSAFRVGATVFSFSLFGLALALSRVQRLPPDWSDLLVGLGFALWLYCIVNIDQLPMEVSHRYSLVARALSGCSYSLYAIHFPILMLIRCTAGASVWQPSIYNLAIWTGATVTIFFVSHLFSRFTEAHTNFVRKRLLAANCDALYWLRQVRVTTTGQ